MRQLYLVFKGTRLTMIRVRMFMGTYHRKRLGWKLMICVGLDYSSCVVLGRVNDVKLIPYLYKLEIDELSLSAWSVNGYKKIVGLWDEQKVMVEVDGSVYVVRVKEFSTWAPIIQKVDDNTEASGSDLGDSLDRASEIGIETSNQAEKPQFEVCDSNPFSLEKIIEKDGQQNKLDDSTCGRKIGVINSMDTKNGEIKDGKDAFALSKPPGFGGQRFKDMETSTKQNGDDGCGLVGNQQSRVEEKVQGTQHIRR
ncbi:hypothetical protein L1987_14345 [Smallanthus sonchifolius]|uniref:Uncharacterized protein n=1 Tax=Smallanthus sonchifolius TaxID=185202 RepID=A0ACB9J3J5_9ASTR|nr:hypothetical protein L1987_14345 [Smallanthus sonchifolius]